MADLLELSTLVQKGIGAETITKILGPLVEQKRNVILVKLNKASTLEDFLSVQAESRIITSLMSQLNGMIEDGRSASNESGIGPRP